MTHQSDKWQAEQAEDAKRAADRSATRNSVRVTPRGLRCEDRDGRIVYQQLTPCRLRRLARTLAAAKGVSAHDFYDRAGRTVTICLTEKARKALVDELARITQ